jgi:serine protease Do
MTFSDEPAAPDPEAAPASPPAPPFEAADDDTTPVVLPAASATAADRTEAAEQPLFAPEPVEVAPEPPLFELEPVEVAPEPPLFELEPVEVAPVTVGSPRAASRGVGTLIAAAVLSAVLASGTTAFAVHQMVPAPSTAAYTLPTVAPASTGTTVQAVDLTDVVARARQSVVTITADGTSTGEFLPFGHPTQGVGSGIILTTDGYVLTNRHVIEGATTLTVELDSGERFPARLVEASTSNDLALVKVSTTGLVAAQVGTSGALQVGQTAIAIGSPLGTYTETVTRGIVSGLGRDVLVTDELTGAPETLKNLIQTDAAINPGNSGGPLLDASGAVIGINTAVSTVAQGLGFAIPIDDASELVDEAIAEGV